jgi:hypothetical protein
MFIGNIIFIRWKILIGRTAKKEKDVKERGRCERKRKMFEEKREN